MSPSSKRPLPAEPHDDLEVRRLRINLNGLRKNYRYTRLQHTDETRLLTIQPGDRESDIHCTLHHVRFSQAPEYEALSYTWGGKEKPCRVECGEGSELAVTRNCFNAIKRLRRAGRSRTVWIDAVCIDQEEDAERGHQVGIMPSIYREATRVVVYLGEAADESDRAMDYIYLDKWQDDWCKTVPPVAVQKLLERPWFSRIWVLQEVYMAKSVTVMCGEKSLPWEPYFRQLKDWPSQSALVQVPQILNMRTDQWNKSTISRNLLDLLARTRHCNCEDPRDRIFALLSMSSEDSRLGINVDYTISVEELYTNLAMHMIEHLGRDEVLSMVEFEETRRISGLPSWMPDWRIPQDCVPMTRIATREEHDNGYPLSDDQNLSPIIAGKYLRFRGRYITTIDRLEEPFVPDTGGWNEDCVDRWRAQFCTYFSNAPTSLSFELAQILIMRSPPHTTTIPYFRRSKQNSYESVDSLIRTLRGTISPSHGNPQNSSSCSEEIMCSRNESGIYCINGLYLDTNTLITRRYRRGPAALLILGADLAIVSKGFHRANFRRLAFGLYACTVREALLDGTKDWDFLEFDSPWGVLAQLLRQVLYCPRWPMHQGRHSSLFLSYIDIEQGIRKTSQHRETSPYRYGNLHSVYANSPEMDRNEDLDKFQIAEYHSFRGTFQNAHQGFNARMDTIVSPLLQADSLLFHETMRGFEHKWPRAHENVARSALNLIESIFSWLEESGLVSKRQVATPSKPQPQGHEPLSEIARALFRNYVESVWETMRWDCWECPQTHVLDRKRVFQCCKGRRLFMADHHAGLVPEKAQKGDIICNLNGARYPVVLRKKADHYFFIGYCYFVGGGVGRGEGGPESEFEIR